MGRAINCLIIGDAPCKSEDVIRALKIFNRFDVCCINRAGLWYPNEFKHWFSWHSPELIGWAEKRPGARLHTTYQHDGVELHSVKRPYGSSTMAAIQVMLECFGYHKAVLAGCPQDGPYRRFCSEWDQLHDLKHRIRSMSGYTKQLFGTPTREWLT